VKFVLGAWSYRHSERVEREPRTWLEHHTFGQPAMLCYRGIIQMATELIWALKEGAVATRLDISKALLRKWRRCGEGPHFVRLGRAVRYPVKSLEEWLNSRKNG